MRALKGVEKLVECQKNSRFMVPEQNIESCTNPSP